MGRKINVYQPPKKLEDYPKRQRDFVKEYVKCGDAYKALIKVGYKDGSGARNKASQLKREMARFIQEEVGNYAASTEMAILGLKTLRQLAEEGSDAVKLNAAKEILSRTLPEGPKEVTVNHKHSNMTEEEVDKRLKVLANQLGYGNVIDVTPEKVSTT